MNKYIAILIALIVAFGVGYYQAPGKVKTVTKTKIKMVTVEKIRVKTVIKESPNGEKITTIVYQNDKHSRKDEVKEKIKIQEKRKLSYSVSLGPNYGAIDMRMLGNLSLGGYLTVTNQFKPKQYGVYIRYAF